MRKFLLALAVLISSAYFYELQSCTRVVYKGKNNLILTGRSMDWKEDLGTNLWIFPRGMERNGAVGAQSVKWKSKYGSVVAAAYEVSSSDGMNEKGLSANLLWLAESEYTVWDKSKPGLSISAWVQYVLDNYATVEEAVADLRKENFIVVSANTPGKTTLATLHLSLSDSNGDNAILEYIKGKLVIHHDQSYQVMTNSPTFEKQLALNEYWQQIGGTVMLPGTNRAADRFVRASFYTHAIPETDDARIGVASVFSIVRNCSVPFGISTPNEPNISSTRWRTLSDHKNKVYYFESALTPNTFWIDFKNVDFSEKGGTKKLNLTKGEIYTGDTASKFVKSAPFEFLGE